MSVRVVGIGIDPENLYAMQSEGTLPAPGTFALVYTTEQVIEQLFGTSHSGNNIAVKAEPGADIDDLAEDVEDELRPYGLVSTALRDDMPSYAGLKSELEQNRLMARSLPALVLAISAMSLFIALSRLVQAQRGEIGLAKALGYSDGQILGHYLTIAMLVAVGGSVLGVGFGPVGSAGRGGHVRIDARLAVHHQRVLPARSCDRRRAGGGLMCRRGCDARMEVGATCPRHRDALRSQRLAGWRAHPARRTRALAHSAAIVHIPRAAAQHLPRQTPNHLHRARNRVCDGTLGGHRRDVRLDRLHHGQGVH